MSDPSGTKTVGIGIAQKVCSCGADDREVRARSFPKARDPASVGVSEDLARMRG